MFKIYGKENCQFCTKAKLLLDMKSKEYEYVDITQNTTAYQMFADKGWRTVPQIFEDDTHIGGFTELKAYIG